jgi:hypothetical protein
MSLPEPFLAKYRKPSNRVKVMCLSVGDSHHISENVSILYWDMMERSWFDQSGKKVKKEPLLWWEITVPDQALFFYNGYVEKASEHE